jgi:hypothetical protein
MIQVHLFKAKEKNNEGRFKAWWPKEGEGKIPMFGGQWKEKEKFPCLVANGRRRKRLFFTSSHFPPQATLLKPSFFFL